MIVLLHGLGGRSGSIMLHLKSLAFLGWWLGRLASLKTISKEEAFIFVADVLSVKSIMKMQITFSFTVESHLSCGAFVFAIFGMSWTMPLSTKEFLICWNREELPKRSLKIWNIIPQAIWCRVQTQIHWSNYFSAQQHLRYSEKQNWEYQIQAYADKNRQT